jgi:hypothetical protein
MVCGRFGWWAVVGGLDSLADDVGFGDPGALGVWEDDGDGVASRFEDMHEVVDVGTGLGRWWAVVVDDLEMCVSDVGVRTNVGDLRFRGLLEEEELDSLGYALSRIYDFSE